MNQTPIEKVLAALSALGCAYKPSGDGYQAQCPAHPDRHPSLSINEGDDGRALVNCKTGCSQEAVVQALNLTMRDLFPSADAPQKPVKRLKRKSKTYPTAAAAVAELERRHGPRTGWWTYEDATGKPVAVVVRWDKADGKTFRPVAKTAGGWRIGDPDGLWPLYRLPELLQSSGLIFNTEGEKKAEALRTLGFTVTTSAHGAQSAKKTDWTPLAGYDLALLPDHDDAGASYVEEVIELLGQLAPKPRIRIVNLPGLPDGGDVVDFIAARRAAGLDDAAIRAEIQELADNAAPVQPKATESAIVPILISLADVKPRPVSWLWPGRIALGKVTLLSGDPGLGKSFVTLDIATRVSRGMIWPDGLTVTAPLGGVVLLSAEDDLEDTIRPRLDAAGADVQRIKLLQAVRRNYRDEARKIDYSFSLETDLAALEAAIQAVHDCRLVIIDPISAYLGGKDSHKNAEIRSLLAPLAMLAAKYRVAVLVVDHLNKNASGPAIYRSMGSLAFVAAARAVWGIVKDKENDRRRLFLPVKNNLAQDALGLAYSIEPRGVDKAPVVAWEPDPVILSADEALQADAGKADAEDGDQAQAWLREALKDGPMPAPEVLAQGKTNGFSEKMIRRAFHALGGKPKKSGFTGGWFWGLPLAEDAPHPHGESWESWESSKKKGESSADLHPVKDEDPQDAQDAGDGPRQQSAGTDDEWGIVA